MTENGDPYKNALKKRVNGIIKTEFNLLSSQLGFEQTYNQIKRSIKVYNEIRPRIVVFLYPKIKLIYNHIT
jgi:hypothetical protein